MLPDNYKLLGLIINTIPFEYSSGSVNATFSSVVSLEDLENLKNQIQAQIENLPESTPDYERVSLTDDLMFVNTMIDNLTRVI